MTKRTRCPKHNWVKLEPRWHMAKLDLSAGGKNLFYPSSKLEVCISCNKVRGKLVI